MNYQIQQLGVGGVLDQAVKLTKDNFGLLFSILAMTTIPLSILMGIGQIEWLTPQTPSVGQPPEFNPGALLVGVGMFFITIIIVFPLANAAIIHGVASVYTSHPTTIGECLRHGMRRWGALIWTLIWAGVLVWLGFIALIIPGIILSLRYALSQHVAVLEETNGGPALKRSKFLMKGNYGTLIGLALILFLINLFVGAVAGLIPQPHSRVIVNALLTGALSIFGTCAWTVFYFSCRCKAEHFDLQILADAMATDVAMTSDVTTP